MNKHLLCLGLLTLALPARAQTVAPVQKIQYRRDLPKSVVRLMPRGAKSLFYGKLPSSPKHQELAFHLFTSQPEQLLTGRRINAPLTLDVISGSKVKRRLNRINLNYSFSWPAREFAMKFCWLDPKTKTSPLLVVDSFGKGDYGPSGLQHFIVLPKGWNKQPVIQKLWFGSWRASDTSGQDNSLVVDEKGIVGIDCSLGPTTSEPTPEQIKEEYTFSLRWDGSGFKPTKPLSRTAQFYYSPPN